MGHNVFLTGGPGSGKTFLLNEYIKFLKNINARVGVTASTGIAATHLNGVTIHSWAGIGIKDSLNGYDMEWLMKKSKVRSKIEKTKVLIIDEVSMLHSYRLDMVDEVCKMLRQDDRPFGGIQVILCGDLFQLPPISRNGGEDKFIHRSRVWNETDLKICYLHEQMRHCDENLIAVLNDIRSNDISESSLDFLKQREGKDLRALAVTKLYTHNVDVDSVNQRHLEKIDEEEKVYRMFVNKGSRVKVDSLKKSCLAPEELCLKKGASVMFVKNNPERQYFNGTLGKVIAFDNSGDPIVETFSGRKIAVKREDWNFEEDGNMRASISQIPLRLAWAITVHKSQGMSLDAAEIDLSKSFVEGMGYVALSRLRSLDGLKLMGLNETALRVNQEILELDEALQIMSEEFLEEMEAVSKEEKLKAQNEFSKLVSDGDVLSGGARDKKKSTYDITKELIEQNMSVKEAAEEREMSEDTIISHLEKLAERGDEIDIDHLKPALFRFEKIKEAFEKSKGKKLTPVRRILGPYFSYKEIRLTRLFL